MPADVLGFPANDEPAIAVDDEPAISADDEPAIAAEPELPATPEPVSLVSAALVEILPADFKLPALIKFVPNPALRQAADQAGTYALGLTVTGADGVRAADLAVTAVRGSLKAIEEHFAEPVAVANDLHKRLTGIRGDWTARGKHAIETVGRRIYDEQRRLEAIAAEERRQAQVEADRQAKEEARRQMEEAARQQAPAPIVEELKRQMETATAPPVPAPVVAPTLQGSTTVTTWKARIAGTPGSADPNPSPDQLTLEQRGHVFELLRAILDGKAPLLAVELNWTYLNKRAKADKQAFAIAGLESFEEGSLRSKSSRARSLWADPVDRDRP